MIFATEGHSQMQTGENKNFQPRKAERKKRKQKHSPQQAKACSVSVQHTVAPTHTFAHSLTH